jgi:hypothetical protein
MEQTEYVSDVAKIRANIEAECEALQNLLLFSHSASHEIIHARFQALDAYHQELCTVMSDSKAAATMVTIYTQIVQ